VVILVDVAQQGNASYTFVGFDDGGFIPALLLLTA
jgi:hypothetical protein